MKKYQNMANATHVEAKAQPKTGVEESLGMSITLYDKESGNHIENVDLADRIGKFLTSQLEILVNEGFDFNTLDSLEAYAELMQEISCSNYKARDVAWDLKDLGKFCNKLGISFVAILDKPIAGIKQLESEGNDFTILTTSCVELLGKESSRKDRTFIDYGSDCNLYFKTKGKLIRGIDLEYCAIVLFEVCNTHSEKAADWLFDIIENQE